jgi:Methyltransferase domain
VQPGDLITAELINAMIDSLQSIDAKADECLDRIRESPGEPIAPFIDRIDPPQAAAEEIVDIVGGGFIADAAGNSVAIGGQPATKFGRITTSLIQVMVPRLDVVEGTRVSVVVENRTGGAKSELIFGRRAPDVAFVPTPPEVVNAMLKMAGVTRDDMVYDLGSGDGRIVIMAAQQFGAGGVGIDIDPLRIRTARTLAEKAGVAGQVKFIEGDFLEADLTEATVIALHLLPEINLKLRPRLEKLRAGTRIVSHMFDMGDWKPDSEVTVTVSNRDHEVYVWTVRG